VPTTQLANEFPAADGGRALLLSASKDLEPGARAMLLHAEGLFRFDVLVVGDSLQTFVRNLTDSALDILGDVGGAGAGTITLGDAAAYAPGRADLAFTLGAGEDQVLTKVTIATLRFAQRGTIRVSAQAIVRLAA
jgi:hypothetical protein